MSPVLARELAAGRARFNAEVASARRARSGFDTDALAAALTARVGPLAEAVEAAAPARTAAVVEAAFTLTVTLVDRALAGERRALVDRVWATAATALAAVVAAQPAPVLAMLTNGALTLAATPGARADEWVERMAGLAPLATADTLAAAGQVAAWRCGMAHYRAGALALADTLPPALALAALGLEGDWPAVRAALAADRWWGGTGVRVGGFTGFGGPFASPPELRAADDGFVARAGGEVRFLVADAWGATLHPAAPDEWDRAASTMRAHAEVGLPTDGLTAATTADSIAYASPLSHYVELRPWRR